MRDFEKSFWAKVDRRGPGECWPWLAGRFIQTGYGQFWAGAKGASGNCVTTGAHRYSWELANGRQIEDPRTLVRHSCHNRACVNPAHLSIGSHADNAADMTRAGRQARRDHHSQAKFTTQTAWEARMLNAAGCSQGTLSKAYGISQQTISHAIRRDTWQPTF